jgi:aquaporin Z
MPIDGVPIDGITGSERRRMSQENRASRSLPWAAWLAECLGTFLIVFAGTGAIVANEVSHGAVTHPGIALTFGAVVMVLIYGFGETSGAHFNPAVTVALAAARRFEWQAVPGYVAVQCGGALAASGLLRWLFPTVLNLGVTRPSGWDSHSLVYEAILTFFLMLVILQVSVGAKEKGITAAVAIGATVGLEAMFAGPICGASMNPARSLGPAVFGAGLGSLWIYCLGPMLGALLSVPVHRILQGTPAGSPRSPS